MLTSKQIFLGARQQRGVVLFLALVVLVAMLLGGIALFRTADTGSLIAGNIAFQKGGTRTSDLAVEAALAWLQANAGATLQDSNSAGGGAGYVAAGANANPAVGQTWSEFWDQATGRDVANDTYPGGPVTPVVVASGGYTIAYLIHRLCDAEGVPYTGVTCIRPLESVAEGSSKSAMAVELTKPTSVYYRVTARVSGPRNTVSFVQTTVVL